MSKLIHRDLAQNGDGEYLIVNGDIALTDSINNTAQAIKRRLLTFRGECFLDEELGLPYFDEILGKGKYLADIQAIYLREIQAILEVVEIIDFNIEEEPKTRTLKINFTVRDDNGFVVEVEI